MTRTSILAAALALCLAVAAVPGRGAAPFPAGGPQLAVSDGEADFCHEPTVMPIVPADCSGSIEAVFEPLEATARALDVQLCDAELGCDAAEGLVLDLKDKVYLTFDTLEVVLCSVMSC